MSEIKQNQQKTLQIDTLQQEGNAILWTGDFVDIWALLNFAISNSSEASPNDKFPLKVRLKDPFWPSGLSVIICWNYPQNCKLVPAISWVKLVKAGYNWL